MESLLEPFGTCWNVSIRNCWNMLERLHGVIVGTVAIDRSVRCNESRRGLLGTPQKELPSGFRWELPSRENESEIEIERAREQESKRASEQDNERERGRERERKKKRSVYSSLRRFFFVLSSLSKKRGERKLEREREHRDARERTREIEGERARERRLFPARDGKIEEERATERAREISRIGEMIERRRSGERES